MSDLCTFSPHLSKLYSEHRKLSEKISLIISKYEYLDESIEFKNKYRRVLRISKNHPRNIFVKQMFLIWISFQNFKCRKKIFWEILAVLFQTKKDYFYPFKNLKKVAPFHSSLKNCCKFLIFVKNWFPLFHEKNFKRSSKFCQEHCYKKSTC